MRYLTPHSGWVAWKLRENLINVRLYSEKLCKTAMESVQKPCPPKRRLTTSTLPIE